MRPTGMERLSLLIVFLLYLAATAIAQNCGRQAGGRTCANNLCCSEWGFCGTSDDHCSPSKNRQSNCRPSGGRGGGGSSGGGESASNVTISTNLSKMDGI